MDLDELFRRRRSVRNFKPDPIPESLIGRLLDAAVSAPSAGNIQPLSILVVQAPERRRELAAMVGNQPWVENGPLSLLFCLDFYRVKKWAEQLDTEFRGEQAFIHFLVAYADLICAAQNVVVLAEANGLGSVYIGSILSAIDRAREYFSLPEYVVPMMVLTLGYPKSVPVSMPKLHRDVMVHREAYRRPEEDEIRAAFEDKYGSMDANTEKFLEKAFIEVIEADKQATGERVAAVTATMEKLGIKNNAQFLFKVRYPAEVMVKLNENLSTAFRNAGFDFFNPIPPERAEGSDK